MKILTYLRGLELPELKEVDMRNVWVLLTYL